MLRGVSRPSRAAKPTNQGEKENQTGEKVGEKVLAYRYRNGLNLWTGEPLTGEDAAHWLKYVFGRADERKTYKRNGG